MSNLISDSKSQVFVSHDPRTFPINAVSGAAILFEKSWFKKLDNGSTTNVELIEISGASGFSGTLREPGFSGYSGFSGTYGVMGSSGDSGYSGYSGLSGTNGTAGTSGYSGYSGTASPLVYQTAISEALSTTTSSSYQTKVSLNLTTGTYIINYCAEVANNTAYVTTDIILDINGVTYAEANYGDFKMMSCYSTFSGVKVITVPSSYTVSVQYKASGGTAQIKNARITAIKG